ncbi:hypothetical protein ACOSQ3_024122 [Xanthoceras sorbifolium]
MHFLDRSAEAMLTINKRSTLASPIKELFPHDGIAGSWCNFKFFLKNTTAGVKHRETTHWQAGEQGSIPIAVAQQGKTMHTTGVKHQAWTTAAPPCILDRTGEAMLTINKCSTLASPIKELFPHDGIAGSWCNFKKNFEKHHHRVQSRSFSPTTASQDHGVILKFFLKNIARSRRWLPTPSPEKSPEKSPDRPLEPPVRPCAMVTPPAHQSNGVRGARGEPMAQALVRSK